MVSELCRLVSFAVAMMLAQPALAGSPSPAVNLDAVEFEGDLDDARRRQLVASIREALDKNLTIADAGTSVDYRVAARIASVERDYEIELRALAATSGRVVATARQICEVCGLHEALVTASSLAATLSTKIVALRQSPPTLRVSSSPPGALIALDGKLVGNAPVEREVSAGEHELRGSAKGFVAEIRRVTSVAGTHEEIHFELTPNPKKEPRTVAGWTLVGIGGPSLAAGLTFVGVHGTQVRVLCSGNNVDDEGNCRFEHDTLALGIGLTVGGAALVATGLALALRKRPRDPRSARVTPSASGLQVRF